ncbi:MAG: alpha/beta hydrolase [Acidimicrobiales bacterium]|nr:alpha/beta hydrolase [Acidimicrobiales bacterium]
MADGRVLGYSEFGDEAGYPILNNHGGLVCRLDVELAHADARSAGVRIISPDRPGVATSDRRPGRDTLDWADDVGELLDALGIDELANMGWSMGGQYALAVAHRLAGRVRATAVIAGCLPLDDQATFAELNEMDRRLTHLAAHHQLGARATFAAMGRLEGLFPGRMAKLSTRRAAPADRAATADHADWMGAIAAAAMRHPQGMVDEYLAWAKPWRFAPEDVAGPVAVWQGSADSLVPAVWGRRLADRIPGAVLHPIDGEGHLIGLTRRAEIIRDLLDVARAPRR